MTSTNKPKMIALCLILFFTALGITLANATTENNYKNDTNFLTNIYESTLTENEYKTNIIINPNIVGIYANENGYKLDLTISTQGIGGLLKENNYQLDLIPEKTFPDIPDIAITKITTSKTVVGQGYTTQINATISNQALNYETLHLTISANTTTIKTQTITLTSGNSTTVTFTWNTTGVAKGNYTITAEATQLPYETDTTDNTLTDGWIFVTILGDVNGDRVVDGSDWVIVVEHVPSYPSHPKWDSIAPNCDLNNDNVVDGSDVVIVTEHIPLHW